MVVCGPDGGGNGWWLVHACGEEPARWFELMDGAGSEN